MKKYSVLLIALSLLPTVLFADIYGGANLGINNVNIKKELTYPLGSPVLTNSSFTPSYTNFHAQFIAGYSVMVRQMVSAALEGNADIYTGHSDYMIDNWFLDASARAEEKLEQSYSLFIIPSFHYSPTVRFFAGPGITYGRFAVSSKGETGGNIGVTGSSNKWLTGGSVKLGTGVQLTDRAELLLTYQFTQYGRMSFTNQEPLSEEFIQGNYKPYVNLVMAGVKFTFPDYRLYKS